MAGRFFATGDTDTESSAESSEEDVPKANLGAIRRPHIMTFSDDEDEKRVVKTLKDKRYDEIKEVIKVLKNSQKIRDIAKVQTEFDSLQKVFQKAKVVIDKEPEIPRFYIRALVELEDFVKDLWEDKEAKAKLNKMNARALASLKQNVRKQNKPFDKVIEMYRANPVESEKEIEDEEDSDISGDDEVEKEVIVTKEVEQKEVEQKEVEQKEVEQKSKDFEADSDSDDSIDWKMSQSSSSDSEAEVEMGSAFVYTADYFLKRDKSKQESKVRKKPREEKKKGDMAEEEDEDGWETVQRVEKKAPGQMSLQEMIKLLFGKEVEIDHDNLKKKRDEFVINRGKKTTNSTQTIENLQILLLVSRKTNLGVGMELLLLQDLIETTFDIPSVASCMKSDVWDSCLQYMEDLVALLENNPEAVMRTNIDDEDLNVKSTEKPYKVRGSLLTFMERLDEEFVKILQATDAHATDFVTKLQGEAQVANLVKRVQVYMEKMFDKLTYPDLLCRIFIRRIEHLYYKIDRDNYGKSSSSPFLLPSTPGNDPIVAVLPDTDNDTSNKEESAHVLMTRLTKFIYNCSDVGDIGRIRTRAVLCQIYHHAIHDRLFQARDLMLMSHLQESIQFADVLTQILYNRALVQLGMCAFRHGLIKDAHKALMDIQSSGRSKELLAQGLLARHDRTPEQEKVERRRQIPFHMHINLELMECVYLTAAMLDEIPYMMAYKKEGRRRIISKSFHHQLKFHEKQPLIGPPESMREHVVAAAHAMQKGDWKACRDYITSIKVWDLFLNVDQVKEMMTRKIQEETLKTYIFAYSETYNCLSLASLVDMFELPLPTVHSIVSRMIFREEMMASLDEPTQTVVVHHTVPNTLQCQALLLADKLNTLADQNEEMMKLKHAGPWDNSQQHPGGPAGQLRQGGQMWRQNKHHGGQRRHIQNRS